MEEIVLPVPLWLLHIPLFNSLLLVLLHGQYRLELQLLIIWWWPEEEGGIVVEIVEMEEVVEEAVVECVLETFLLLLEVLSL